MPTETLIVYGRTYSVRRTSVSQGRYIHVRGPMEFKRPHHGMYDTYLERWITRHGLAGGEGHMGSRVQRFYRDANEAIGVIRGESCDAT